MVLKGNRVNSFVPQSLSKCASRISCRKSFLLVKNTRYLNIRPFLPPFVLFPENVFKHKEILLIHTLLFLLFPPMVSLFWFGWFLKRAHSLPAVWFLTATCTCPGCSPVIFKAWLSSDKVSSTHSLSTSAVFLEVNQSILPSGTNGNLPERNNYCTQKSY